MDFTEEGSRSRHWLKRIGMVDELDRLVPVAALVAREGDRISPALAEEKERMKLCTNTQKAELARNLDGLEVRVHGLKAEWDSITGDRLKRLVLEKQATQLWRELMRGREDQYFDAMRLDVELEESIKEFVKREKLTAKVIREFIVRVEVSK